MINWQDKAYRTLQEHVLRNTQDIRELFKKLRHTRWTPENVAKLYDSLTALKYDDPEIALDLIDELITALGGNPPARPKHALIGIKAETTHGAVDQYDLIDKDWFSVTAYFEDGTSEPVDEFLLLTEVALTAPYTNVEIEYLGFRDIVPLAAKARRVITLNTANTTTVVNDQTGRVLHNGDSVFDGDVLTMASSQPNGGYLITGRNVEQLGIVNPIDVGGSVTVQADVIVNVFAKAKVYHTVTINKASGVTFTLVDEDGNNVASGASLLEGTKIIVTALSDTYPHAAVVGGELIQLYVGTVIVVSDDVVITVGEAQPEPPVEYVRYLGGYPLYEGYGGTQWMDYDNIPKGKTLIVRLDEVPTGEVYEYDMFDENDNVIGGLSADKNTEWQPIVFDKTFGIRFKQPTGWDSLLTTVQIIKGANITSTDQVCIAVDLVTTVSVEVDYTYGEGLFMLKASPEGDLLITKAGIDGTNCDLLICADYRVYGDQLPVTITANGVTKSGVLNLSQYDPEYDDPEDASYRGLEIPYLNIPLAGGIINITITLGNV